MPSPRRPCLVALAILIASCGSLPTQPSRFARYGLEMTVTRSSDHGDPAHPVTVRVRVVNTGRIPVYYGEDCLGSSFHVDLWAPDRANILQPCVQCPGIPCPLCPGHIVTLAAGESVEQAVTFSGTLLSCNGTYQGQAGVYAVEATMGARLADGQDVSVSRATSFEWSTPAPR